MYSINHQAEHCIQCEVKRNFSRTGWFVCQECFQIFCHEHCILHRHPSKDEDHLPERYDRQIHLDQIAQWERKAIERIQRQANEARRPLIAPPTPITPPEPMSTIVEQLKSASLTRLLSKTSNIEKEVRSIDFDRTIDPYELISDPSLDELIGDSPLTSPPNEISISGRISFSTQCPFLSGVHFLRLSIDHFPSPSSWAFVGIISNGFRSADSARDLYLNRSSFGWHLGRQSIIYDRHCSTNHHYDGRNIRSNDIMKIQINCQEQFIQMKNERTQESHQISIDLQCCPLPWFFAVNFNYETKDSMRLLL